jgi:hypothetical protein
MILLSLCLRMFSGTPPEALFKILPLVNNQRE